MSFANAITIEGRPMATEMTPLKRTPHTFDQRIKARRWSMPKKSLVAVQLSNPKPTLELPPALADMLRDLITYRATGINPVPNQTHRNNSIYLEKESV